MRPVYKKKRVVNRAYLNWIARQSCSVCYSSGEYHEDVGEWLCNPCHIKSRGAGGDDTQVFPACQKHHNEQHKLGMMAFETKYRVNLSEISKNLYEIFQKKLTK